MKAKLNSRFRRNLGRDSPGESRAFHAPPRDGVRSKIHALGKDQLPRFSANLDIDMPVNWPFCERLASEITPYGHALFITSKNGSQFNATGIGSDEHDTGEF